jgi:SAM-dependent methyltransferase
MKIINAQVSEYLSLRRPIRLDLGAGGRSRDGFFSVDHLALPGVDIVADLNQPLALLPDNCCEYVATSHTLEHVRELLPLMAELHRILRPGGVLDIVVPHFSNPYGYSDPTHVRFFGLYSMHYFADPENRPGDGWYAPAYYTATRFTIEQVRIRFQTDGGLVDRTLGKLMNRVVNRSFRAAARWERRICWLFHAIEIQYLLHPRK